MFGEEAMEEEMYQQKPGQDMPRAVQTFVAFVFLCLPIILFAVYGTPSEDEPYLILSNARIAYAQQVSEHIRNTVQDFVTLLGIPLEKLLVQARVDFTEDANYTIRARVDTDAIVLSKLFFVELQSEVAFMSSVYLGALTGPLRQGFANAMNMSMPSLTRPLEAWFTDQSTHHQYFSNGNAGQEPRVTVQGGGGFGFGFQLYCGCQLILSTGTGHGGGFVMSSSNFFGDHGGGGGIQVFKSSFNGSNASALLVDVGGGGGGTLGPDGTSHVATQPNETCPYRTFREVVQSVVRPQIEMCPADLLSLVGGGGSGFGFEVWRNATSAPFAAKPVTMYGGGLDLQLSTSNAEDQNKVCNGTLLNGTAALQWKDIEAAIDKCRNRCQGYQYTECQCPCMRLVFQARNQSFASTMTC